MFKDLPLSLITSVNNIIESHETKLITEALAPASMGKASYIILKYLRRKTKIQKMFYSLGMEKFKNGSGKGFGIRFYAPGKKIDSWRFNWSTISGATSYNLKSIDVWMRGPRQGPNYHIEFEQDVSLVQILPQFVDILLTGDVPSEFIAYPPDVPLTESYNIDLAEAVNPSEAYDSVVAMIASGDFTKHNIWVTWKSVGIKIFEKLEAQFPELIQKQGRQYVWNGSSADAKKILGEKNVILGAIGTIRGKVSAGSAKEIYSVDKDIENLENKRERLAYTKQLEDLENLIKMTISGASNALFIAGRGGIGKTHTVEKVLQSAGLSDGNGYFKNTGTASAAGIYSLLFKYKDDIILFDDSDDALKDQEARNMFKAATDTKKIRKLVWNKMGKNVVDPDSYDGTDDELIDDGYIPRFFNFTGKIIFISNLKMDKLDPDGAIRTRAFLIEIDPTEQEIYDFMDSIVGEIPLDGDMKLDLSTRKSVVTLLRKGTSQQTANLRKLSRALNMKAGSLKCGVDISDNELTRMIEFYA
jgi:hypothetical protein